MLSHVFLGVSDFDRALRFYRARADALGLVERFCEPERPWAGWQSPDTDRPLLLIGRPFDGRPHAPGNGQMTALLAGIPPLRIAPTRRLRPRRAGTASGVPPELPWRLIHDRLTLPGLGTLESYEIGRSQQRLWQLP